MPATKHPYAQVSWSPEDIVSLLDEAGVSWTQAEVLAFMSRHEKSVQERMTEIGWDVWGTWLHADLAAKD